MKKILVILVFGLLLIPLCFPAHVAAMTGNGTAGNPYMIYDVTDLQNMNNDLTAYYKLANDIDASATANWNWDGSEYLGFVPIGESLSSPLSWWHNLNHSYFGGSFDGNGYTISNLHMCYPIERDTEAEGLFGHIYLASIKNVELLNAYIIGSHYVGILVGDSEFSTITNCIVNGVVAGCTYTGGLAGYAYASTISNCGSYAAVYGTCYSFYLGGFVGRIDGSIVTSCFAYGSLDASLDPMNRCTLAGGFAGSMNGMSVSNSYSRVTVSGTILYESDYLVSGGFVGSIGTSYLLNCYSTGEVSGFNVNGGLVGETDESSTVVASFWDSEKSGLDTSNGGTGETTSQMKTKSTYTDAGWDFNAIWTMISGINDGYPFLPWDMPLGNYTAKQVLWFQPNAMISGDTLPDRMGNVNGNITWGTSAPNVTAAIGETVTSTGSTPAGTNPNLPYSPSGIVPQMPEPAGWYPSCNAAGLPFYTTFNSAANHMGMPVCSLYLMILIALSIAVGLTVAIFTGSALISTIMAGSFMATCIGTTIIGWWMVFTFVIIAAGTLYLARTA